MGGSCRVGCHSHWLDFLADQQSDHSCSARGPVASRCACCPDSGAGPSVQCSRSDGRKRARGSALRYDSRTSSIDKRGRSDCRKGARARGSDGDANSHVQCCCSDRRKGARARGSDSDAGSHVQCCCSDRRKGARARGSDGDADSHVQCYSSDRRKEPATTPDEAASEANTKATAELASLKPGFSPKDLVAALNDSVINFRSGSAELPASIASFLQNAAEDLKRMPAGYVLEIAGYTDNTGDAAKNVALSRRRADAVREALVKSGANADMLVAKGYGSADPIASNDTPDGRLRNRRIEYRS